MSSSKKRRLRTRARWTRQQVMAITRETELSAEALGLLEACRSLWESIDLGAVTIRNYLIWSRRLLCWLQFRKISLRELAPAHLEDWVRIYYRHSFNTRQAVRVATNAFLQAIAEKQLLPCPISALPEEERKLSRRRGAAQVRRPHMPEPEDVRKLVETARERKALSLQDTLGYTLLMCFCHTGLRASEVASLDLAKCHFDEKGALRSIRVKTKWGHDEEVQVNDTLRQALAEWMELREAIKRDPTKFAAGRLSEAWINSHYIFPNRLEAKAALWTKGDRFRPMSYGRVYEHIKRLVGLALGPKRRGDIHPHSLRHFFASELLHDQVPVDIVKSLMRHRNIASLNPYLDPSAEDQRKALARLGKKL